MSDLPHFLGLAVVTSWKLASHIMNEKHRGCSLPSWLLGPVSHTTAHLTFICLNLLSLLQFPPDAKADITDRKAGRGETEGHQTQVLLGLTPKLGLHLFLVGQILKKNKPWEQEGSTHVEICINWGVTFSWKHLYGGFLYWPCGFSPHWYYYLIWGWQKNCLNLLISLEKASWGSC